MCSLFDQAFTKQQFKLFGVSPFPEDLPHSSHIVPSQPITILRAGDDGRTAETARWGLIRSWNARKPGTKTVFLKAPTPTNSRDDSIFTDRIYSGLMPKKRCIIPAAAWAEYFGPPKGKTAVWLEDVDGAPLFIAAIYDDWRDPETDQWIRSASMVTVPSNDFTRPWHEKRRIKPLYGDGVDIWMDNERYDEDELKELLADEDEGRFRLVKEHD